MSLLLESIKLVNGEYQNIFHHEQRMNHSLKSVFGEDHWFNLEEFVSHLERPPTGLFKCRIVYDDQSKDVQFIPYIPKTVNRLRLVEDNEITYEHKFVDRENIDKLYAQRRECDDVLIIKEGQVTDSSYSNILFKRKERWFTPGSVLLRGTMRQHLLERNAIYEEDISVEDIMRFDSFKLINAMLGFQGPEIDVSHIVY